MGIVWLIAIIAFGVLEAVTAQLISIWFAGGALVALIAYLLGVGITAQWITFVIASALLLILTKSFVKRFTHSDVSVTGTDMLIGSTAVMTKETDNRGEGGEAKADGKIWTVKSADGEQIPAETIVTVEKIEGVKLIVRK